jgi:hypothetical protein
MDQLQKRWQLGAVPTLASSGGALVAILGACEVCAQYTVGGAHSRLLTQRGQDVCVCRHLTL